MKKILLIGTAALGMFFMTTSCLENTEPAGIEAMRQARAELISAQAAYEQAKVTLLNAQTALQEAQTQNQILENNLKELEIQEKQLNLEYQEAKYDYDMRILELDYARRAGADEAYLKALEVEIAGYEYNLLKNEIDMEELELQRQEMVEHHKAVLLGLQQATAEAQKDYEEAIRNLEALKHTLTADEKAIVDTYTAEIDALSGELETAENELVGAQTAYLEAKYNWSQDSVLLDKKYTRAVELAQAALDDANAELEEANALDFTDEEALLTQKAELEAEIDAIRKQQDDLKMQAEDLKLTLEVPEAEIAAIDTVIKGLDRQIEELNLEIKALKAENPRTQLSLPIDNAIVAHFVGQFFETTVKAPGNSYYYGDQYQDPNDPNNQNYEDALVFQSEFKKNEETNRYELPSGTVSWTTTQDNHEKILADLKEYLYTYELSEPQKATAESNMKYYQSRAESISEENASFKEELIEARNEWNELSRQYQYTAKQPLDVKANEALSELTTIADLTAADVKERVTVLLDTIRLEQQIRLAMTGYAEENWENFTYANLTDPASETPITLIDLQNAVNNISINPAFSDRSNYPDGSWYYDGPVYYDAFYDDAPSAACRWDYASRSLLGMEHYYGTQLLGTLDEMLEYTGYGEYYRITYTTNSEVRPFETVHLQKDAYETVLYNIGYNEYNFGSKQNAINAFCGAWFVMEVVYAEYADLTKAHLEALPEFPELIAAVEALEEEIKTADETNTAAVTDLLTQIRSLYEQRAEQNELKEEKEAEKDAIIFEIKALTARTGSEWAVLNIKAGRLEHKLDVFDAILEGTTVVIDGTDYTLVKQEGTEYVPEDLAELKEAWIERLEKEIKGDGTDVTPGLEYELLQAQQILQKLHDGMSDDLQNEEVKTAERELAQAQAKYDELLEEFNYWNDLLSDYIASLTGNTEETPEA